MQITPATAPVSRAEVSVLTFSVVAPADASGPVVLRLTSATGLTAGGATGPSITPDAAGWHFAR